jgi:hypothetical protein
MTKFNILAIGLLVVLTTPLAAEELTALELVEKVYNRPDGEDMQSDLKMSLVNSRGDARVREIRQLSKDFGTDEKKIMFFQAPADVRNTSFMNWTYGEAGKSDDQWIFLPALKKVKRISSDSKGDYFMGSDFTYDDLGDRHPASDTHKVTGREEIDGEPCTIVESVSIEEDYIYSKTLSWIADEKWIVLKKEFYDEDDELLKILTVEEHSEIDGYWTVTHSEMQNLQRDHTTIMILENIKLDQGVPDNKFTERIMARGL